MHMVYAVMVMTGMVNVCQQIALHVMCMRRLFNGMLC